MNDRRRTYRYRCSTIKLPFKQTFEVVLSLPCVLVLENMPVDTRKRTAHALGNSHSVFRLYFRCL